MAPWTAPPGLVGILAAHQECIALRVCALFRLQSNAQLYHSLAGHFTRKDRLQVIAVPIIVGSKDLTTPAPVIIYTAPENPLHAPVGDDYEGWETEVPFPDTFVLVHEVTGAPSSTELFHNANNANNAKSNSVIHVSGGYDAVLLSGRDGINTIWFDSLDHKWVVSKINDGLPEEGGEQLDFLTDPDPALTGFQIIRIGALALVRTSHCYGQPSLLTTLSAALGLTGRYTGYVGSASVSLSLHTKSSP